MSCSDLPRRQNSLRHPKVDYRSCGAYFVTICAHRHRLLFGTIRDGIMDCSPAGHIVWSEWYRTEALREKVVLDAFVVMPDHVHGILCLVPEGVSQVSPHGYRWRPNAPPDVDNAQSLRARRHDPEHHGVAYRPPHSLSSIIGGFKGAVTRRIRTECDVPPDARIWQRNFYDRVLRNEREWRAARRYIRLNPQRW